MELKDCFREDFTQWLLKSNNKCCSDWPRDGLTPSEYIEWRQKIAQVEKESLQEILDILLKEPLADYFWYRYPEYGGELTYLLPHHVVAPGGAIRVDKEKIKIFLRDIKIETLLQCH